MIRVYIAGPYTKGNVNENVREAVLAADELVALGYLPFVPHLYHLWDLMQPHPYEHWMMLDMGWLRTCDVLLRLPGESSGADREVAEMRRLGRPVVHTHSELLAAADEIAAKKHLGDAP